MKTLISSSQVTEFYLGLLITWLPCLQGQLMCLISGNVSVCSFYIAVLQIHITSLFKNLTLQQYHLHFALVKNYPGLSLQSLQKMDLPLSYAKR